MPGEDGQVPKWAEFDERPAAELEPRGPAAELAEVLQRSRRELDAAARASAQSRVQGLRALAEQAVLAIELEKVIEVHAARRDDGSADRLHAALRTLKDRMLAHVAAAGLEVVRLRGVSARAVYDFVEVDGWCYGDAYPSAVVVDELEVAVTLDGRPLRMGRVVIGAPREPPQRPADAGHPVAAQALRAQSDPPARSPGRVACPVEACGTENDPGAEYCSGCLTQLAGYIRLSLHPDALFNRGLRAARAGDAGSARDCFAAVMLWQPDDVLTRNAYALACLQARDPAAAQRAWEEVLSLAPEDALARRGLAALPKRGGAARWPPRGRGRHPAKRAP